MDQLTVRILDRDYRLTCEPSERETLLAAVAHVDANMRLIREQGKIVNAERIAVLAALNIAGALLSNRVVGDASSSTVTDTPQGAAGERVAEPEILRRMQTIDALLDAALGSQETLF